MDVSEYKPCVIDTGYLFPPSLADFLGSEDEVHVFREAALLCLRTGMVNLGHPAPNGTKLKASACKHRPMSYTWMKQ